MRKIEGAFKQHNANMNNVHTGDCVLRAISLALGEDYRVVRKELRDLTHLTHHPKYNHLPVFREYLRDKGYTSKYEEGDISVQEFTERYPKGTYILLTGRNPKSSRHLVCVIDGDIYDTWDSSKDIVNLVWRISDSGKEFKITPRDVEKLEEETDEFLSKFLVSQQAKMPYAYFSFDESTTGIDYGFRICVRMRIDREDLVAYNDYYTKYVTLKLNPVKSYEEQYKQVIRNARDSIREWIYGYRKDIEDFEKEKETETNPRFYGDKSILIKMPEWAIPYILSSFDNRRPGSSFRYELMLEALPEFSVSGEERIEIDAPTIPILRKKLEYYKQYGDTDWDEEEFE